MRLKKIIVALMSILMCLSVGHYTYADDFATLYVYIPSSDNDPYVVNSYTDKSLGYVADNEYMVASFSYGEEMNCYVYPKAGYEVDWYISDTFSKTPSISDFIRTGNYFRYSGNMNDNNKYLIGVVRGSSLEYNVFFESGDHGSDVDMGPMPINTLLGDVIREAIATEALEYRDESYVLRSMYTDSIDDWEMFYDTYLQEDTVINLEWGKEIGKVELTVEQPEVLANVSAHYDDNNGVWF